MKPFVDKYLSRKFLVALGVQVTGVLLLFNPGIEDQAQAVTEHVATMGEMIAQVVERVGTIAAMAVTAWGYFKSQGSIDQVEAGLAG